MLIIALDSKRQKILSKKVRVTREAEFLVVLVHDMSHLVIL